MIDLYDTTRCPLGHRCESCGAEAPGLAVVTATTPIGVLCLTVCPCCSAGLAAGTPPPVSVATAGRLATEHGKHLGREGDPR